MKTIKDTSAYVKDTVVDQINGIKIYARRTNENQMTLNASYHEKEPIDEIASMLHARGYGVKREKFVLDAKPHFNVEAVWPGEGGGPYPLPQNG